MSLDDKEISVFKFIEFITPFLDEIDKRLLTSLSEDELKYLVDILSEYLNYGESKIHGKIINVDYVREVVSIDDWLDNPYYLGGIGNSIYPVLRDELKAIFSTGNVVEVILSGSIGYGKTFLSQIMMERVLYELSCLRNPQEYLGIADRTPIVLCNLSVTGDKSGEYYTNFKSMVDASPYFKDNFPRLSKISSSLIFPNQIVFMSAGAQETGVIGSNILACFTGDTKISLLDGTEKSFEELVKLYPNGESFWVYSCKPDGTIVPGKAHSPRITKYVTELCEVTLDNNEVIRCTPDHRFMLRNGTYKEAKDLAENESLMPLYRLTDTDGYELVWDNKKLNLEYTHRKSAELCYKGKRHVVRHHRNFNKKDNTPYNLKWMSYLGHYRYHGKIGSDNFKKLYKDPVWYAWKCNDQSEKMLKLWDDKEFSKIWSDAIRKGIILKWQDTEFRNNMKELSALKFKHLWNTQRERLIIQCAENGRKVMNRLLQDPEYRKRLVIRAREWGKTYGVSNFKKWNESTEGRRYHSYLMKSLNNSESFQINRLKGFYKTFNDPEFKKRFSKMLSDRHKNKDFSDKLKAGASKFLTENRCNPEFIKNNAIGKVKRVIKFLFENNIVINQENYDANKPNIGIRKWKNIVPELFSSYDDVIKLNHKVVSSVIKTIEPIPVYDISVIEYNNFSLTSGVFVHNSVLDEVNFMKRSASSSKKVHGSSEYNQALQLYDSINRRLKSRFMFFGKTLGKIILISSKRYPNDFLEEHVKEIRSSPNVRVLDYATWQIKPSSHFSGKWFHVFIGDLAQQPRILDDSEVKSFPKSSIVRVPEEYRIEFDRDILASLRDIAGIAILGTKLFINNREMIDAAFDKTRQSPVNILHTNFEDGFALVKSALFVMDKDGTILDMLNYPGMPRYFHIDMSETNDATGFSMGCYAGLQDVVSVGIGGIEYIEAKPKVHIDLAISIYPDKKLGEVNQHNIRALIETLKRCGVTIELVTTDRYQSTGFRQELELIGLNTEVISVDRTPEPYLVFKSMILTGRVSMPPNNVLQREIGTLERDTISGKIDHSQDGSKDIADCVAAISYKISQDYLIFGDIIPTRTDIPVEIKGDTIQDKFMDMHFHTATYEELSDEDLFLRQILGG